MRVKPEVAPSTVVLRLPWRSDPAIATLTAEILTLQMDAYRSTADGLVEIGRRLAAARERLEHGEWEDWVATAVPFDSDTARNYVTLAEFASGEPDEYQRVRHLGVKKLLLIAPLPPQRRNALLGRPLTLPGSRRKTIEVMKFDELRAYLRDPPRPRVRRVPVGRMVRSYVSSVKMVVTKTHEIAQRHGEVDHRVAQSTHADLLAAAAELEDAFGL